ncbi:MAG: MarR family transcriptional regulator [Patescibacteria group bacterium]
MERYDIISEIAGDFASFKRVIWTSCAARSPQSMPTPAQIGVLALVASEGPQNLKDLAGRLCMSSSAATQLVDGLVADRMLTRTEDSNDRRRIKLALTESGKLKLAQAKKARLAAFTRLLAPLSEKELNEWRRLQRKIIEHAA